MTGRLKVTRRAASIGAICLMVGAVVNVPIGWHLLRWSWIDMELARARYHFANTDFLIGMTRPRARAGISWPIDVPSDWPSRPDERDDDAATGVSRIRASAAVLGTDRGLPNEVDATVSVEQLECGWPFKCMYGVKTSVVQGMVLPGARRPSEAGSIGVIEVPNSRVLFEPTWLPFRIRPLSFTLNAIVYAIILATCWYACLGVVRFLNRFKRPAGLCRSCRYDLAGLPMGAPCPECGTQPR